MTKLLITGGTGFWGKNVLNTLLQDVFFIDYFDDIMILSRNVTKFKRDYPEFCSPKFTLIEGDVRHFECERTDIHYILHLATDASKDLNDNRPLEMMDTVINGTKHVLELAAKQTQLKRFLMASSGAVYGDIPDDIDGVKEEQWFALDFNNPINAYAQSKCTAEMLCQIYHQKQGLPMVIARGFAFVGDYLPQDTHFAIGNFIKQAKEEGKITIKSDGSAKRSYMDAKDLAKILLNLLIKEHLQHIVYNVGSAEGLTLKEWAYRIAQEYGDIPVEILGAPQEGYSAGKNYVPNVDRIKNITTYSINS